jgi:TolB-like protein/DNA-binding winged helix-turn-helix (wHTH) protein/Tfp pilus assembly protein PilF
MGFECYRIGDLTLDAGTQEVTRDGEAVPVPGLSFKLLLALARHAPNVVAATQLKEDVWNSLVVDKGTINKRVLLLRKALGEAQGHGPYITVVRGSGYRLEVPAVKLEEDIPEPTINEPEQKRWYDRSSNLARNISYWLLGVVAVLALYQGYQNHTHPSPAVQTSEQANIELPEAVLYSNKLVAVLPFVDMSEGKDQQYLGDGVAEEVINLLAGMEGLEVAARTSSFAFRDSNKTAIEIARELHVGTILEGSFRLDGNQIRFTAQLIDAQHGYHLWSKNYDRDVDRLLEVQDAIAQDIAQALKLTLEQSTSSQSGKRITSNIQAFSVYLKGMELLEDRISLRSEGLRESLQYFEEAIELDPQFARAYAGQAAAYWLLSSYDLSLDRETYYSKAEASAKYALELDPESIEALGVLAAINSNRGAIVESMARFEQIRSLGRSNANILHWQATLLMRLGYFERLIAELSEAYRLDPLNERTGWALASAYSFSGQPEAASAILNELEHFTYRDFHLALIAIFNGDFASARVMMKDVRMRSGVLPGPFADTLIDGLENVDQFSVSETAFVEAIETGSLDKWVGFEALLILGSARAFELDIDPLNVKKSFVLAQVWNSWAVDLRQDTRFKVWLESMGFVEFWQQYGWPDRCQPTGPVDFECI